MQDLKVALLWHMHQPSYWDSKLGKYRYPWAFLHGARHYHMMGHLASLHPEMRLTINVTSVLMDQLDHYAGADQVNDALLEVVLKPAADLNEEELRRLLDHVFRLNAATMIDPYPRYRELRGLLGGAPGSGRLRRVKPAEITDLQTLYLLAWCGMPLRESDPVRSLLEKERDYTEEDKRAVFETAREALRRTLPLYRTLQDRGQVELSTTPYFHPILPLLIDSGVAREARPGVHLDDVDFRFRADAAWQVAAAARAYEQRFGRRPEGMWPAEGGVSDDALFLLAEHGIRWAATDEGILARSAPSGLAPLDRYRPYRVGGKILVFFRDRELSDRIGFVYSGWNPVQAADDFVGRLRAIRDQLGDSAGSACVPVILDGENPWEHYPDAGMGFLTRLYRELPRARGLAPVTFREQLESANAGSLGHVVPGSWIDANFDTWIGAPRKNHAWKLLAAARHKLALEAPGVEVPQEIYRAEGSDWFWWLGPGHDTPYEDSYENLFRLSIREGLRKAGVAPPPILNAAAPILPSPSFQPPMHLFSPKTDGRIGNYYDWIAAGFYRASDGSFHRATRRLSLLRFGFDADNFYLRLEGNLRELRSSAGARVVVEFHQPRPLRVELSGGAVRIHAEGAAPEASGSGALDEVAELSIPRAVLGGRTGEAVEFAASMVQGPDLLDRLPQFGYVSVQIPGDDFGRENWSV